MRIYKKTPAEERFWRYVEKIPFHACWEWVGGKNIFGYGRFNVDGKMQSAHRFSYGLRNPDFDRSLNICHRCDNPGCVNPDHLFAATQKENIADRDRKGRRKMSYGDRHYRSKITSDQAKEIKALKGKMKQTDIAKKFGINRSNVARIISGKYWKHI